ncbi:MAG: ccmH [Thermoleophilia bacterium]|jgi:cytochrome c-type biogenesis protein CcmH/NrfF|nr:ccmH [Thermoleophilia bacterium]
MTPLLLKLGRVAALVTFATWVFLLAWMVGVASSAEAATPDYSVSDEAPVLEERRSTPQTNFATVGATVMCPSCDTTLDQSNSPAAEHMRVWVRTAIAAGWTEEEIRDGLVAEYGGDEAILAVPRARGLGLAVWVVPGIVILAMLVGGWVLLRRWRRDPAAPEDQTMASGSSTNSSSSAASSTSSSR